MKKLIFGIFSISLVTLAPQNAKAITLNLDCESELTSHPVVLAESYLNCYDANHDLEVKLEFEGIGP